MHSADSCRLQPAVVLSFQGLDPLAGYKLTVMDEDRNVASENMLTGAQLYGDGFEVRLPKKSSVLIRYCKISA